MCLSHVIITIWNNSTAILHTNTVNKIYKVYKYDNFQVCFIVKIYNDDQSLHRHFLCLLINYHTSLNW